MLLHAPARGIQTRSEPEATVTQTCARRRVFVIAAGVAAAVVLLAAVVLPAAAVALPAAASPQGVAASAAVSRAARATIGERVARRFVDAGA